MTYPVLALAGAAPVAPAGALLARHQRGRLAYQSGFAAEAAVERDYIRRGMAVAARRWRGRGGEIDLIMRDGADLVFVEVKAAASFGRAAERLSRRQMDRICGAALEYLAGEPRGQLTGMRFDLATVDGLGRLSILENAFGEN